MVRIAICDDEAYFRELVSDYITEYMSGTETPYEIDGYSSGKSFLALGPDILNYQIVFLDINMEGMDGIETAKRIRKASQQIYLVFVTAYLDYTLEGYKVDAVRYLLKRDQGLKEALNECMDAIFRKMNYAAPKVKYKFHEGEHTLSLERLVYVESKLHKLEFHVIEGEETVYTLYGKLSAVEAQLKNQPFIRVHQSFLVNMKYIRHIERYRVVLNHGEEFPVPRARYQEVSAAYLAYKGAM